MKNNIITLYPSVMDSPLWVMTKTILANSREVTQKEREHAMLDALSTLEKHDVKLQIVK